MFDDIIVYLNVISEKYNKNPLPLYRYQVDILKSLEENNFTVINKSRQIGISFAIAGYLFFKALSGKTALIISPSERQSKHLMEYVNIFIHGLDKKYNYTNFIVEHTKSSVIFENGGWIRSLPNSANSVRGFPADYVVWDEFGHFLHNTDLETYEALLPSISATKGHIMLISTPFGENNLYYSIFNDEKKYPDFKRITVNYKDCAHMNVDLIKNNYDELSFQQEFENMFIGEQDSFFPYALLKECVNMELTFLDYIPNAEEICFGVDVGRRIDFTAIVGVSRTNDKYEVFYYRLLRNTSFEEQRAQLSSLVGTGKIDKLLIDETGMGMQLSEELRKESGIVKPISMTHEIKNRIIIDLKRNIEDHKLTYPDDIGLINSMHYISRKQSGGDVSFSAASTDKTGHSDAAIAFALALYGFTNDENNFVYLEGGEGIIF